MTNKVVKIAMGEEDRGCPRPGCHGILREEQEDYCRMLVCPRCGYTEDLEERIVYVRRRS
jgi:DNA-directed RNA polymerase subunit M/transcription elongation factor TFIIS